MSVCDGNCLWLIKTDVEGSVPVLIASPARVRGRLPLGLSKNLAVKSDPGLNPPRLMNTLLKTCLGLTSLHLRNGNSVAGTQGCLELWKRGHFHMSCVDTEMKLETCHCLRCGPKAGRKCNSVYIYLNKLLKKSLTFWLERLFWKELAFQKL